VGSSSLANAAGGGLEDEMVRSESREAMGGESGRVIGGPRMQVVCGPVYTVWFGSSGMIILLSLVLREI
jgi:hypothetical protein